MGEKGKLTAKDDPLPWMGQGCAILFREFERLHLLRSEMFTSDERFAARSAQSWKPESRKQLEDALVGAERLAQSRWDRDKNDVRALFAMTILNGLRADDAALLGKENSPARGYPE